MEKSTRAAAACGAALAALIVLPRAAAAQDDRPFRAGLLAAHVRTTELDTRDTGVGVLFAWHPIAAIGAEVEVTIHPADMGPAPAFSGGRVETHFGVSAGPRRGRVRPFVKARPGILRFWRSPEPFACIAVFPAPVRCTLAAGRTAVALDLGGGLEVLAPGRTFLRVEAGDRLISFPGPVRDSDGAARDNGFFAHDLRITAGAGVRF